MVIFQMGILPTEAETKRNLEFLENIVAAYYDATVGLLPEHWCHFQTQALGVTFLWATHHIQANIN